MQFSTIKFLSIQWKYKFRARCWTTFWVLSLVELHKRALKLLIVNIVAFPADRNFSLVSGQPHHVLAVFKKRGDSGGPHLLNGLPKKNS